MSRMCCGSRLTSNASAASVCIRKASSNDWMRASNSASCWRSLLVPCVQLLQQIQLVPLLRQRDAIVADVFDQLFDRRVLRVEIGPLEDPRQEAGLPVLRFLDRVAAGAHGDERGQILVLGAQPVGDPRTDAGADLPSRTAVHQQQRRLVVGHVGVHGADDGDVVDRLGHVAEQLADLDPAFAVLAET